MKNFIRTLLTFMLVALTAFGLVACAQTPNDPTDTGVVLKKYAGEDFYTVYSYVDDGVTTELDLGTLNTADVTIGRIANNAFKGNGSLTKITVPTTVTEIGASAFAGMKKLNSLVLPFVGKIANADAEKNETASGLEGEKAVDIERTLSYYFDNEEYDQGIPTIARYNTSATVNCYIPATLSNVEIAPANDYKIPMYAFSGINTIRKVVLSNKVVGIGEYAFSQCNNLDLIEIPASVTKIYDGAFAECAKLTNLTFADGINLAELGDKVFYKSGKKSIVLPASVAKIGEFCFAESSIRSIEVGANLTEIKYCAFYNCVDLVTVKTAASLTGVTLADYAFDGCSKLANWDATTLKGIDLNAFNYNANAFIGTKVNP